MPSLRPILTTALAALLLLCPPMQAATGAGPFNVRDYGAKGDGTTVDSDAINRAIEAASAVGGGTVVLPAGTYLSFSIRLKSNIHLHLDAGCTLLAASPELHPGRYDPPEPNEWGDKQYQDFGHSHWHNSLIWGEDLQNVAITGLGRIHGKGLIRHGGGRRRPPAAQSGAPTAGSDPRPPSENVPGSVPPAPPAGGGNKAIALKHCRNVTLRDIAILEGGWFALLATGVDNLTIDNVRVDTNRDGFDIDACRNVRVTNCLVNAPNDDAIVLKSSYALGQVRACENVTITGCHVSGFDVGTVFDGTFLRTQPRAPDRDGPTGRIKFGTESNGGFRNITITNCTFTRSRGLAIETVDGGVIEDVAISNLTMREVSNSPIFIRLGNRARGPEGTPVGRVRRLTISHVVASDVDPRYPILIAGLPGHLIEDVRLSDITIEYHGGIRMEEVALQPSERVNPFFLRGPGLTGPRDPYNPPENEKGYPEPSMFGILPAYALFVRHAANVDVRGLKATFQQPDERAPVVLMNVARASFSDVALDKHAPSPTFVLRNVRDFAARNVKGIPDTEVNQADDRKL